MIKSAAMRVLPLSPAMIENRQRISFMSHTRLPIAALIAAGFAFGGMTAPNAVAQTQMEQGSFSDEMLKSFAEAAVKLTTIRLEFQNQMQEAETTEQQMQLQQQTNQRMAQVVQDTPGITIEEYNAIAEASQSNPELAARVDELIQEASE
jgi:hypothetical protein